MTERQVPSSLFALRSSLFALRSSPHPPFDTPPGPSTWLLGQLYGNTTGAYRTRVIWYGAGQGLHFGLDFPARCGTPVTSMRKSIQQLGNSAVELLLAQLADPAAAEPQHRVFPPTLVVRGSCGGAPA